MKYIALALIILLLLRFLVALVNFLWIHFTLDQITKSKKHSTTAANAAKWSLLIPARNEERNIDNILSDIYRMSLPPSEVIVFNDNSSDGTAAVVKGYQSFLPQLKIIESDHEELSEGWLGKNRACHLLAKEATGTYLLFVDADVRLGSDIGNKWIGYAINNNLSLLSVFPKQIIDNNGSRLTVPIMNWILLSLLPLPLIRYSSWSSFSAANGQFMLFKASDYHKTEPHSAFRSSHAEDIAISRFYKTSGYKIATLTGNNSIRCRMYNTLDESLNGFSKNVLHFFGNSISATLVFVLVSTLTPLFLIPWGVGAIALWLIFVLLIRVLVSAASQDSIGKNCALIFLQHFFFIVIVIKAIFNRIRKKTIWKGRNIY